MEFSRETGNVSVGFETFLAFLDHYELNFPRTFKIVDGFCGTNDDDSLDADQIFVFYKVERQKVIMALDEFCQEICVQQNSNLKVYLLPLECDIYSTVQEFLTAQSPYILVLEDISSAGIVAGSRLKLLSDRRSIPNYLKCQVVDRDDPRDVYLPLHLTGKFLPLLDCKDYFLDEVLSQKQLPINVRFVSESTKASDRVTAWSLTNLGNIRLTYKSEVAMTFVASVDTNKLSLYMFPKTLDITVSNGFKVSAETSKNIKQCRKALEKSETSLKRLDHVVKDSFYFTASPVRRFSLQSLQKTPPIPLPRSLRAKYSTLTLEEKLYANTDESTKRVTIPLASNKRQQCAPSLSISDKFQYDGDYENCETGKMSGLFKDSGRPEEVNTCLAASETSNEGIYRNFEAPASPLNKILSLTGENKVKEAKPNGTSRPVPKPRKRLVAKVGSQEISKDSQMVQTQWQRGYLAEYSESTHGPRSLSKGHVDETYTELPPLSIGNEEEENPTSQDEIPPPLPPKNGKKTCPEQQHNENDLYLEPITRGETPPPALFIGNGEEEENPTSQEDNPTPLPPKNCKTTFSEQQHNADNKGEEERITRGGTPPTALPPKKKLFSENHLGLAYLVVDVSDWKKVEDNYYGEYAEVKDDGRVFKQDSDRNSYLEVIYQAGDRNSILEVIYQARDTEDNPAMNNQKPGEQKRLETDCEDDKNKLVKKKTKLTSLVAEHIFPGKTGLIIKESEVSKPSSRECYEGNSDVYVECYDRTYVNQEIKLENNSAYYMIMNVDEKEQSSDRDNEGIVPTYYNIVEIKEQSSDDRDDDGIEPTYYNTVEIKKSCVGRHRGRKPVF